MSDLDVLLFENGPVDILLLNNGDLVGDAESAAVTGFANATELSIVLAVQVSGPGPGDPGSATVHIQDSSDGDDWSDLTDPQEFTDGGTVTIPVTAGTWSDELRVSWDVEGVRNWTATVTAVVSSIPASGLPSGWSQGEDGTVSTGGRDFDVVGGDLKNVDLLEMTGDANITNVNSIQIGDGTISDVAQNVAAIGDPSTASAEDCANKINVILASFITAGIMNPGGG